MEKDELIVLSTIPPWLFSPIWYVIVILFGVDLLAPRAWTVIEQVWWRLALGNSTASQLLRKDERVDFDRAIKRWVNDRSLPHPLAVLLAILERPLELRRLTGDLKGLKEEMSREIFKSAVRQLNKGWLEGKPPEILKGYIKTIEDSAEDSAIDETVRLRGESAASVVKYALGELVLGNRLGAKNWTAARRLESDQESELKWIASYGYFNSTLFLGDFKKAMNHMATQWSKYYAPLDDVAKESLKARLFGHLILNPILAIPRHMILAAAFSETSLYEPKFWPSEAVYNSLTEEERRCKIRWASEWYEEAKRICAVEPTSLHFSHAYAGFYFTLLLLEPEWPKAYLHEKINEAFKAIDDSSPTVAQYAKHGFKGVYHLVCGDDEKALESLSYAARFSAISGNRFADCVFMSSHAVAAARLNQPTRFLDPDIKHYLAEADRLAHAIGRPFYKKMCYGAKAAVALLQGEKVRASQLAARSKQGGTGSRILKIFFKDGQEP